MDKCGPHGGLLDTRGQDSIFTLPWNCTFTYQPMDMGVIVVLQLKYKSCLHKRIMATIDYRNVLREEDKILKARLKGLGEGHDEHVLDACDLVFDAWEDVSERTVARCWIKADIPWRCANSEMVGIHGKLKKEKNLIGKMRSWLSRSFFQRYSLKVQNIRSYRSVLLVTLICGRGYNCRRGGYKWNTGQLMVWCYRAMLNGKQNHAGQLLNTRRLCR